MTNRVAGLRTPTSIADLIPDPKNARRHNDRNVGLIVGALSDVGAGRSIVIDETGTVLAGNATREAAARAGITKVQVIDADGETLVAVRRSGLTDAQKTRLALYDNRAAELADWDASVLRDLGHEIDLEPLFDAHDLRAILDTGGTDGAPASADEPDPTDRFGVIVLCDDEGHQRRVYESLQAAGHRVRVVVV